MPTLTSSNSAPMFLAVTEFRCEIMNMVIEASPAPLQSIFLPMVVVGATTQFGAYNALPMSITGSAMGHSINLYVKGHDAGGTSQVIRLFVQGGNPAIVANIPLFIHNDADFVGDELTLFVGGDGLNPGYTPAVSALNLFVQRGPNAGIPLFLCNNNMDISLPMYVKGAPMLSGTLDMFLLGPGGGNTANITMFVNGGTANSYSDSVTMVIPETTGLITASSTLYVNGFNY